MKEPELKQYFALYTDCWKFFRKYVEWIGVVDQDTFWKQAVEESAQLYAKYRKSEFAKKLLAETMAEIDRVYKREGLE